MSLLMLAPSEGLSKRHLEGMYAKKRRDYSEFFGLDLPILLPNYLLSAVALYPFLWIVLYIPSLLVNKYILNYNGMLF